MTPSTVLELAMKHCFPPVLRVKYPLLAGARSSFSDTEYWFCSGLQSVPLRASMHLSPEKGEHLFRIKSEPRLQIHLLEVQPDFFPGLEQTTAL